MLEGELHYRTRTMGVAKRQKLMTYEESKIQRALKNRKNGPARLGPESSRSWP